MGAIGTELINSAYLPIDESLAQNRELLLYQLLIPKKQVVSLELT